MKRFGFPLPLLFLAFFAPAALGGGGQTLLSQDFEGPWPPPGWTVNNGATGLWRQAAAGSCGAVTTMAAYNDSATCTYNTGTANGGEVISPPVTLSGQGPMTISFNYKRTLDASGDSTCVTIRTAGVGGWTNLSCSFDNSGTYQLASIPIPAVWEGDTVEFGFRFSANIAGNNNLGWEVDNILVQNSGPGAPVVSSVSPDHGPNTGQPDVVITGSNFTGTTQVLFGANAASFTVDSDTQITADLGATGTAGWVDVSVTNPGGTGTLVDGFDYFVPPSTIGTNCSTPFLTWSGSPTLGETYTLTTQNLGTGKQLMLIDWSNQNLPRQFLFATKLGCTGNCAIYVQADSVVNLGNNPTYNISIANDQTLIGVHLKTQALIKGCPNITTQGLDALIGE